MPGCPESEKVGDISWSKPWAPNAPTAAHSAQSPREMCSGQLPILFLKEQMGIVLSAHSQCKEPPFTGRFCGTGTNK